MKKLLILGVLVSLLTTTACSDYLDVNQNPNYPTEMNAEGLLPSAILYSSSTLGFELQMLGSFWSQHVQQYSNANQYVSIMQNNLTFSNYFFYNPWIYYYAYALPTLADVKKQAALQGDNYKQYTYVANVLTAFDLHILTSCYDKVAWSQGGLGKDNLNPVFDSGAEIYATIIDSLESLRSADFAAVESAEDNNPMGAKDFVFGGNMENWKKFVNTLYLKMLLRDFTANSTKIQALLAEGNFLDATSGDAKVDIFVDLPNKSNPFYENDRRMLNSANNVRSAGSVFAYVSSTYMDDPRRNYWYEPLSASATQAASSASYGVGAKNAAYRLVSKATDPICLASEVESYFLQAEAYARLSSTVDAKTYYEKGVKAAFARFGLDGSSFLTNPAKYQFKETGTVEQQIEQIIVQKWLAAVGYQAWDSWFDLNRTGYPKRFAGSTVTATNISNLELLSSYTGVLSAGQYPVRLLYPKRSSDYNVNTPTLAPLYEKMWWHK